MYVYIIFFKYRGLFVFKGVLELKFWVFFFWFEVDGFKNNWFKCFFLVLLLVLVLKIGSCWFGRIYKYN